MDTIKEYSQVIKFIREHKNGETVDLMNRRHLIYNMSYGVSLAQILQFVKNKQKHNELAELLWKENIRETKLISFHFFEPHKMSEKAVDNIVNEFTNHELVEQGILYFIVNLPFADKKIEQWLSSDKEYVKMSAFTLLGRMALKRKDVSPDFFGTFFEQIRQEMKNESLFIKKSIIFALTNIARTSAENKTKVTAFIKELSILQEENMQYVIKNVSEELEYI